VFSCHSNTGNGNGRSEKFETHIPLRPVGIGHGGFNNIVARTIVKAAAWKGNLKSKISNRRPLSVVREVKVMYECAQCFRSRG